MRITEGGAPSGAPSTFTRAATPQRRSLTGPLEVRQGTGGMPVITGLAIVYNRVSLDLGGFRERIAPGASTVALASNPDVLAAWDHDTRYVLGRNRAGTLRLGDTTEGLRFAVQPPDTSWARDLITSMERGDTTQCSFMFTIADETWDVGPDGVPIATVHELGQLYDVTVTARGAYPQTTSAVEYV